ncbi:aconitate hydratase [Streptomyces griseochromogenes]|uniref:Aconitate hydratase n=1 Tax=Streptomyces griseochromogenes TaxID=68214 RepID=A0ABS4LKS9_9ACTN|nr:aconitate hydratase AcnA [Streptomyces griseochromogenes]MBP2047999.1 aconitate hydratase [Streptomyces griseochromogenes]
MNTLKRPLPGTGYSYISLEAAAEAGLTEIEHAPRTTRVLVENVLRQAHRAAESHDGAVDAALGLCRDIIRAAGGGAPVSFNLFPVRLLLQDHSGVPVLADLASLRSLLAERGLEPGIVSPSLPVDLVVDHSVEVHSAGTATALRRNMERETRLNSERFRFLKWAHQAMEGVNIVPPGRGIVHQIHLEQLARVVNVDATGLAAPDTVLGTDSHTPMVNSIGVLGWGIGGLDASAVLLGLPLPMLAQPVVGVRLVNSLPAGTTATDLALTLTEMLRAAGVVHSMVEFFGPGADTLPVTDRATVSNMAPEFGCTTTYFPVDEKTLGFLRLTGRSAKTVDLVARYSRAQGLDAIDEDVPLRYSRVLEVDLAKIEPCAAGPRRPQDRMPISQVPAGFRREFAAQAATTAEAEPGGLRDGAIAIAAITSCTSTSNQTSMLLAGLLARNAVARGLTVPPWVKTSMAPGSRAVRDYLDAAGLLPALGELGFSVAGYGCTTCIGNSGPLVEQVENAVRGHGVRTAAVLSGNRNFEGRIHQDVAASYLMSPPLVVAYALAGTVLTDLTAEPLGTGSDGRPVALADIWPTPQELEEVRRFVSPEHYRHAAEQLHQGEQSWRDLDSPTGDLFDWPAESSYLMPLPLVSLDKEQSGPDVRGARALVYANHTTTTDHISPAGQIRQETQAGQYLSGLGVKVEDFNTFGCRRGNHEVMMRGTFAGSGLVNRLVEHKGGSTLLLPERTETTVYEAAMRYQADGIPLVVLAGREYGMGSSRDWAAKGPRLLGVKAVLAESFERIHRSNLVAVGILPLQFTAGQTPETLGLTGCESFDIIGLDTLAPGGAVEVRAHDDEGGQVASWTMTARVDTERELQYIRSGGVFGVVADTLTATAQA